MLKKKFSIRPTVVASYKKVSSRVATFFRRFPLFSFICLLGLLLMLIIIGSFLRQPAADKNDSAAKPKTTQIYTLGAIPEIAVQAKVDKAGTIKIVALSGGIVQKVHITEGTQVKRGTRLFSFSTNYQGGNTLSLSRQISQRSYQTTLDTYQLQKDSIATARELANKAADQASELRDISRKSIDETKNLISLNEDILSTINAQLKTLEQNNLNGANDQAIAELKGSKAQVVGALNGLQAGLRNTEYLSSEDQEAAKISQLSKDQTLKQLDLQEKTLELNKDIALLNLRISQVTESLMYPTTPCPGTVERVFVKIGQSVAPGTVLATIRGNDTTAEAVALVSSDIARNIAQYQPSHFTLGSDTFEIMPRYVAQEPTDGNLHAVTFNLPEAVASQVTQGSFLAMTLPVASGTKATHNTFVPLDSIYQSQDAAYVLVVENQNGKLVAKQRQVTLQTVFGEYVEVLTGLNEGDQIVLNRNILDGDVITLQ